MFRIQSPTGRPESGARPRTSRSAAFVLLGAALTAALLASLAFAAPTPTLRSTGNSGLGATIVVDSHGRTLYALSPETTRHLLCKSSACFAAWPPLTVRSRSATLKAGSGIAGRLGLLRRSDGKLQVTLRGIPLYRFSGDSAGGEANGEGIRSFGGTWHAVRAKLASNPSPVPTTPGTTMPAY